MGIERKILQITKPTIVLDELSAIDADSTAERKVKQSGGLYPLVQINGHRFTEDELVRMYLDETSFIPRINISIATTDGFFLSKHFPKDGDPMSLFIRSKLDEFKPIRMDFEIMGVQSMPSTDDSGEKIAFIIEGIMRVPGLFAETCKSYNMTSYDCLLKAAVWISNSV